MHTGFPGGTVVKKSNFPPRRLKRPGFSPWVRKFPWSTPVFLPGNLIERGAWWPTVHRVIKSQTQLSKHA